MAKAEPSQLATASNGDWPQVEDVRLLRVLAEQVAGALRDLHHCSEDGLGHLARAMEMHPRSDMAPHILAALTDLQKIDRAMQRLKNVETSLSEWSQASVHGGQERPEPAWAALLSSRYVMPDENVVLNRVLQARAGK